MSDTRATKDEPGSFADLANQPTGSGVADEQTVFEHPDAVTTDENDDRVPTQDGPDIAESEAQPS